MQASNDHAQAQAEIANQRYAAGCFMVDGLLIQGKPIYDPKTRKALARGVVVCDRYGNTGRLIPADFDKDGKLNAVVGEVAFTGNPPIDGVDTKQVRYIR
ncbi:hypothetical protein H6G80_28500 [Nostoc sp. FACHB-87]|uniref:hypothetical protein n=1 Tax=Nostocaceae TaxID=1162 RepID=UPI001689BE3D|nr:MULTISPECIES: hypothetical protein [Nostocaceae]MBD2457993.1 hypothetical protein [Nostoc sp. FACHB-87]MBD2479230.1 hypothetical protein [Anabaena sp. FACHB-83]